MQIVIRNIGNSKGVVLPKPLLAQVGLDEDSVANVSVENGAIVLRKPAKPVRSGWADAAEAVAAAGDDALLLGEFGNAADADLTW
ncbi:MAG: AbrB/MazE/SpoVT family DNA-binding domain-containing protein [Proteobacteria bacterium]|nr:AbrB/MazE/SpoVT family DNA-binding domain-containing protein [Pseudomonadota bacterium]